MTTTTDLDRDLIHRLRIDALVADYIHCIDEDRLEEWPDFFTADGRYKVITRENYDLGLPVALIYCDGRGMFEDRISALRTANIYEPHVYCHMVSALKILDSSGPEIKNPVQLHHHPHDVRRRDDDLPVRQDLRHGDRGRRRAEVQGTHGDPRLAAY